MEKNNENMIFDIVSECEYNIEMKQKEINNLKEEITKMQEKCSHPLKVCIAKQTSTVGENKHESHNIECLICGKPMTFPGIEADIDLSNLFKDCKYYDEQLKLRRDLARILFYINKSSDRQYILEHIQECIKEEKQKTLVKK